LLLKIPFVLTFFLENKFKQMLISYDLMDFIDLIKNQLLVTKEPMAGFDIKTIFTLLKQNKFYVSPVYYPRFFYSLFLSSALSPFRFNERRKFDDIINSTDIEHDPLFLIGHWRGGTTYLHYLLKIDKQFGFFSTFDTYIPSIFLSGEKYLKIIVANSIPDKRPMDDVIMDADLPNEDEYAIGGVSVYSYYHGWCFPRNMDFYNRYVWLDDVSDSVIKDFKNNYLYMLRKSTLKCNGRRLLLKNPSNTARIKILHEMFPDAKFVHIHRNPYYQILSMIKFMRLVIPLYCVQKPPSFNVVEKSLLDMYEHMYRKFFVEKKLIPKENFIEICYEDFIMNPLSDVDRIYSELGLDGFDENKKSFNAYILSQVDFKTDKYTLTDEFKDKIYNRLDFVFKEFNYEK
jgi:hypothetical protein